MNEYRREFREAQREVYWTMPRVIGMAVVALVFVGAVGWLISALSTPAKLVTRALNPDNIINNYEFFHDANNQVIARVNQIRAHRAIISDNKDQTEVPRLRIELAAIQQSCRDLVGKYNANATKVNRSIFMGRTAPDSIHPSTCE